MRKLSRGAICDVLRKRAREANVESFSPDDLLRSRELSVSGRWQKPHNNWTFMDPSSDLCPRRSGLALIETADANDTAALYARLVARWDLPKRARLATRLDTLAGLLSDGQLAAAEFDWCGLSPEAASRGAQLLTRQFTRRNAHAIWNALGEILREGVRSRLIDEHTYRLLAAKTEFRPSRMR
jgi:hypothetical protein